jgi:hypothetical protein
MTSHYFGQKRKSLIYLRVKWAVPLPFEGGEEAKVLGENP